ncbi:hypothetical protein BDZ89DRAFT_943424 [Hymenopellis radicata]|nr:hypothetical protein BDZ89DRAFT_943424 [Hymenopellis radicata]
MLANYTDKLSFTHGHWAASSLQSAVSLRRGRYCARVLRRLVRAFILDHTILPLNPYGSWNTTMLENEDLAEEIKLHLQELGDNISAEKLVIFLSDPALKDKYGLSRTISLRTAQRYLNSLEFRWQEAKKGQFVDGHERADVVNHRDHIYIPGLKRLKDRIQTYDRDGKEIALPAFINGRKVIIWFHDESIFYAHDRRRKMWIHKDATAKPYRKGEGVSLMIADFVSAEFGWLVSRDGKRRAREILRPGKNRDGYFDNADILRQANKAADILAEDYPEYEHVFVYDNATTHRKRPDDALSARHMPKNTPSSPDSNWFVTRNVLNADGKPHVIDGKYQKEKIRMCDTVNPMTDEPQSLYFPEDDHQPGMFKGMVEILVERGFEREKLEGRSGLKAECKNFKCAEGAKDCCIRRILFNQPDFAEVKSILESVMEARGIRILFLPKFHCELNPIEQCWGYAKRLYRLNPESSKEDKLEEYALDSLERIPLVTIRRFFTRAFRFVDAYERGLNGKQAAWASRKYRGHRVLPESILDELEKAGMA